MFDLKGKTVVITGSGGVLCSRMAKVMSNMGARVAVLSLHIEHAQKTAAECPGSIALACDILDKDSINSALQIVLARFGQVDVLINGAGGNRPQASTTKDNLTLEDIENKSLEIRTFFDIDPEAFGDVFNLNIMGTLMVTQVFGLEMAKSGGGSIINISSMNSFNPLTRIPAYSAAKAGVSNLTKWLAVHFAPVNIRVNAIAPGFFLTEQNRFLLTDENTGDLTCRGEKILAHTPMNRFGNANDLDGAVVFLASEASGFVTGVILPVDGGFSAYSGV